MCISINLAFVSYCIFTYAYDNRGALSAASLILQKLQNATQYKNNHAIIALEAIIRPMKKLFRDSRYSQTSLIAYEIGLPTSLPAKIIKFKGNMQIHVLHTEICRPIFVLHDIDFWRRGSKWLCKSKLNIGMICSEI